MIKPQNAPDLGNIIKMIKANSDPVTPCKINIRINQGEVVIALEMEGTGEDIVEAALGCVHAALQSATHH